jgi:hypothetical protein
VARGVKAEHLMMAVGLLILLLSLRTIWIAR